MPKNNPFELERVSIRLVRDAGGPLISDEPLNTPGKVAKLLHDEIFADLDREMFAVVNLKTSMAVAGVKILAADTDKQFQNLYPASINICSMGSLNESVVHPREVLKSSILNNANAVLLVHNHPSSNLQPSREDIQTTDRLIQAYDLMGIAVLDHIILGPNDQYYSMNEQDTFPIIRNEYKTSMEDLHFGGQMVAEPEAELRPAESALKKLRDAKAGIHGEKNASKNTEARTCSRKPKVQGEVL